MKHKIVSHQEWLASRKALLEKEKAFTRSRDEMGKAIRDLPWEKVEKQYQFSLPHACNADQGAVSLADLFNNKNQLIIYHFMFGPEWTEGCKSCSLLADHFNPLTVHIDHRDVSLICVSRAPVEKLEEYKKRMGWSFTWASSLDTDFNFDFRVSHSEADEQKNEVEYNYRKTEFFSNESPGLSVFYKDDDGSIYHTYSCFGRGLEDFMSVYRLLDVVPKGRDEADLAYGMEWVKHRDQYDNPHAKDQWKDLIISKRS